MGRWQKYYGDVGDKPNRLTSRTLEQVVHKDTALDLAAGNFRDTNFLLREGFTRVVAVDTEGTSARPDGVEFYKIPIEQYAPQTNRFNLALCWNTFFFLKEDAVRHVWRQTKNGLVQGGVFGCNLLGERDDWVGDRNYVPFTENMILSLLCGFEVIYKEEKEGLGHTASGRLKYIHIRNLILRKL